MVFAVVRSLPHPNTTLRWCQLPVCLLKVRLFCLDHSPSDSRSLPFDKSVVDVFFFCFCFRIARMAWFFDVGGASFAFAGSYRTLYFELSLLPVLCIDLIVIVICSFLYCTKRCRTTNNDNDNYTEPKGCCCKRKEKDPFKYYPMKKISFDEMNSRKKIVLEPVNEIEFDNAPPKPQPQSNTSMILIWMFLFR